MLEREESRHLDKVGSMGTFDAALSVLLPFRRSAKDMSSTGNVSSLQYERSS